MKDFNSHVNNAKYLDHLINALYDVKQRHIELFDLILEGNLILAALNYLDEIILQDQIVVYFWISNILENEVEISFEMQSTQTKRTKTRAIIKYKGDSIKSIDSNKIKSNSISKL